MERNRKGVIWFLDLTLTISIGVNIVLIARLNGVDLWNDLQLALVSPPTVTKNDHARGPERAPVVVVDYSDFQCPFSADMYTLLRKLAAESKIKWVYRHYPLSSLHPFAFKEAAAAECAGDQGNFWQYADALVDGSIAPESSESLVSTLQLGASRLGVDVTKFQQCLASDAIRQRIERQIIDGDLKRIHATPTIFVNGKRLVGNIDSKTFSELTGIPIN